MNAHFFFGSGFALLSGLLALPFLMVASAGWALNGALAEIVIDISASQILNVTNIPILLIPAQGPGKAIIVVAMSACLRFGTVPFNNPGGSANPGCDFAYTGPNGYNPISSTNFLYNLLVQSIASTVAMWSGSSQSFPRSEVENQSVVLINPAGKDPATNFIAGDSSLRLTIIYAIASL